MEFPFPLDPAIGRSTVCLITGACTGIGLATVKAIAAHNLRVIATSPKPEHRKVIEDLNLSNVHFYVVDVTNKESIEKFIAEDKAAHPSAHIDILINCAGIKGEPRDVINVNYRGTRNMCEAIDHMFRNNSRIINVASRLGCFGCIKDEKFRDRTERAHDLWYLDKLADEFIERWEKGEREGLPPRPYDYAESLLLVYTRILAHHYRTPEQHSRGIHVVAVDPGLTDTVLTREETRFKPEEKKTPEQGADSIVWAALVVADHWTSGHFIAERREISMKEKETFGARATDIEPSGVLKEAPHEEGRIGKTVS